MPAPSSVRVRKPVAEVRQDSRLRKHADYQRVYREGKRQSLPLMTYFFAARKPQDAAALGSTGTPTRSHAIETPAGSRVGLTAGKVLGNAVDRNRIKRRMRQAIRQTQTELTANVDVVLHPRRTVLDAEFSQIERDVQRAFRAVQQALNSSCEARLRPWRLVRSGGRPGSSDWPVSISDGFLPACMPCPARCCRCPADVVFSRHVRSMRRSRWRGMAGCGAPKWQSREFRAVIHGVARGASEVSIRCRKFFKGGHFLGISLSRTGAGALPSPLESASGR